MSLLHARPKTETSQETGSSGKKHNRRNIIIGSVAGVVGFSSLGAWIFGGKKAERGQNEDTVPGPASTDKGGQGGGETLAREADIKLRVTNHPATKKMVAFALGVQETSITPENAAVLAPVENGFGSVVWKSGDNSKLLSVTFNPRIVNGKDKLATAADNAKKYPQSYEHLDDIDKIKGVDGAYYQKGLGTTAVYTTDFELGVALFDITPKAGVAPENARPSTIGIARLLTQGYLGN